jgi:hypothetical protein
MKHLLTLGAVALAFAFAPAASAAPQPSPDSAVGNHRSVKAGKRGYWVGPLRLRGHAGLWMCWKPATYKGGPMNCRRAGRRA